MAKVELKKLVERLNPACHMALENAASLTVAAGHREVMIEHFLIALLELKSADLRFILRHHTTTPELLADAIRRSFSRFREGDGQAPVFSPLLIELLQDAWMVASVDLQHLYIRSGSVLLALLGDMGRFCRFEYAGQLDKLSAEALKRDFSRLTTGSIEEEVESTRKTQEKTAQSGATALEKYTQDFTAQARDGKIDPVFCRDDEIRQIIDILARRRKNNPICVGEAGVGKTAVVEGLALKIIHDDVPDSLKGAQLYGLDLGALQAGASVKGEFEKRLKAVLDEIRQAEHQSILFIDEAHTLIGAGGQAGGSDAANLLKPALARGEIKTIAATTWSEYKKYFEKDPALTRRFQLVKLDEPTIEQARIIIRGLVPAYEAAHGGIYISDEGVEAAVQLSSRYITGRQLPDKAIDVLDTACARVKATATGIPLVLEKMQQHVNALEQEKATLERDRRAGLGTKKLHERLEILNEKIDRIRCEYEEKQKDFVTQQQTVEELKDLRQRLAEAEAEAGMETSEIDALQEQLREARMRFQALRHNELLTSVEVGAAEIAAVISDWTGIPASSMTQDELGNLLHFAENIGKTIKGQSHALQIIEEQLQAAKLELVKDNRPLGAFLLVGPSGVGKTETALEVARQFFGGEQFLTVVNMTEFQEKHTTSRLIGSPPGYVGYGEGGYLTEAIRKKPYCVVLLDEVEKADKDVLNLFYQVFDKGILSDGEGREIDCKNVVFFLCSNLAAEHIEYFAVGGEDGEKKDAAEIVEQIRPILADHFKPALLGRMQPIVYMPLPEEVLREIVHAKLERLKVNFVDHHGIVLDISEAAQKKLLTLCRMSASGARLIDQMISRRLLPEIARLLLHARLEEKVIVRLHIDVAGNVEGSSESGEDFTFQCFETAPPIMQEEAA